MKHHLLKLSNFYHHLNIVDWVQFLPAPLRDWVPPDHRMRNWSPRPECWRCTQSFRKGAPLILSQPRQGHRQACWWGSIGQFTFVFSRGPPGQMSRRGWSELAAAVLLSNLLYVRCEWQNWPILPFLPGLLKIDLCLTSCNFVTGIYSINLMY